MAGLSWPSIWQRRRPPARRTAVTLIRQLARGAAAHLPTAAWTEQSEWPRKPARYRLSGGRSAARMGRSAMPKL
jgi:hypothetical protein